MTGSPLADLLVDWIELGAPRDTFVPRPPDAVVPFGICSVVVDSAVCPSFDSVSSFVVLSPFFLF